MSPRCHTLASRNGVAVLRDGAAVVRDAYRTVPLVEPSFRRASPALSTVGLRLRDADLPRLTVGRSFRRSGGPFRRIGDPFRCTRPRLPGRTGPLPGHGGTVP